MDRRHTGTIARLLLENVGRPYPAQIALTLFSDADARPPRMLTPAFSGSYDWHSSVHSHWALVRLARTNPGESWCDEIWTRLASSLTSRHLAAELQHLGPRRGFERPYGLAWLLLLDAELCGANTNGSAELRENLAPLVSLAWERLLSWLALLPFPVRTGQHNQSAFAMGLALDSARETGAAEPARALVDQARRLYINDKAYPLHLEPSGEDFLSPSLGAADLMRRVLDPMELEAWLAATLPSFPGPGDGLALVPVTSPDPDDGRLAHLDGLCISRAFMLEGIANALPRSDKRRGELLASAATHGRLGLERISADHYAGAHWLPTFAVYYLTRRGHSDAAREPQPRG